jgi:hypothetical protein
MAAGDLEHGLRSRGAGAFTKHGWSEALAQEFGWWVETSVASVH